MTFFAVKWMPVRRANPGSPAKTGPPAIIFVRAGRFLLIVKMSSSEPNWSTVNPSKSGLCFLHAVMIFSGLTSSPSSMISRPAASENIRITSSPCPRPSSRVAVIINGGMSHSPGQLVFFFHSRKSPAAFSSPDLEGNPCDCHFLDSPSSFSRSCFL